MDIYLSVRRLNPAVNKVSSLRDLNEDICLSVRRLKPAVNKVSSLRDLNEDICLSVRRLKNCWCEVPTSCRVKDDISPQRHPELVSGSPCFQEIAGGS